MREFNKMREHGLAPGAFTLMEVIVAVIIVGMTAIATLSTFGTEFRTAATSRTALEAVSLARNRLAILELTPAEELQLLPDSSKRGQFEPPFESYEWTATVSPVLNEADLFDATVRVTSTGGEYSVGTRLYRPVMVFTP
ncbi:MAG TPA: type II secretion system protein [Gemmatimonadaceae bacterium]|nr:type II secretion system protein [Gemmatimonadaceae bacterium]